MLADHTSPIDILKKEQSVVAVRIDVNLQKVSSLETEISALKALIGSDQEYAVELEEAIKKLGGK